MPTNRRNDEVSKSFAIGTKIEYMNKLFEVTESNSCCDCSLATICSGSDISASDRNDDALSRDKRINIFGECSSLRRPDNKSVVFVEVPMTKSDNNNNTINSNIIQPLVEANGTVKALQIKAPTNFEIDVESSDLSKGIIRFKRKWLSLEQLYKSAKDNNYHTCFSEIKDSIGDKTCEVREKLIALSNLMDIARYFNGNWEYHNNGNNYGYMIAYDKTKTTDDGYQVVHINSDTDMYFGNIMFKNEADAQYVIDNPNFRSILDVIVKV